MPAAKRQRQRSARARQAAALQARRRSTRRRAIAVAMFLVILLVLGLASVVGGGGGSDKKSSAADPCKPLAPGGTPVRQYGSPPPMCIDPAKTYTATMKTSKGTMEIALDPKKAPKTVNNFVYLARNRFFDGLNFHRVVPGFVAQGGSPSGDSSGDVGYKFADELPQQGEYKVGSVVMANSGPDTNGSQFFIVTGPQGVALPPKYSLFGQVTQGLDVVAQIDAVGTPNPPNTPKEPVNIESVTIKES